MCQCVEQAMDLAFRTPFHSLRIGFLVDRDVPSQIMGDPTRLRQVLTNLLGNAFKFTAPQGDVMVIISKSNAIRSSDSHLEAPNHERSDMTLQFCCRDNGPGRYF